MRQTEYHDYLKSVPLFEDLNRPELDIVGAAATELTMSAGTVLMREGTPSHEMVIVLDGTLSVSKDDTEFAQIGVGGFAGEMGLLTGAPRNASVTALTEVRVLHIDGRVFETMLDEAPTIARKMLPIVAERVAPDDARHD